MVVVVVRGSKGTNVPICLEPVQNRSWMQDVCNSVINCYYWREGFPNSNSRIVSTPSQRNILSICLEIAFDFVDRGITYLPSGPIPSLQCTEVLQFFPNQCAKNSFWSFACKSLICSQRMNCFLALSCQMLTWLSLSCIYAQCPYKTDILNQSPSSRHKGSHHFKKSGIL